MDDSQNTSAEPTKKFTSKMPEQFGIQARGFTDADTATRLATIVGEAVRALGGKFDLSGLDGITLAVDYNQALLDLDRGYETNYKLTATNSHVVGVAMTPGVLRNGALKSHIVLNAHHISPLIDLEDAQGRDHAIHILAHECGHVEVTNAFDRCFPNVLLRQKNGSILEQMQWQVILAVWDEFAVTSISAGFGESQTEAYENTFINDLAQADKRSNRLILNYREHGSVDQILGEIYGCYGDVLKFAAYHLGNLEGLGIRWQDSEKTASTLKDHWFLPYFERLQAACLEIAKDYGEWKNKASFTLIANIIDDLVERAGLLIEPMEDDRFWVDIPYTPETDPLLCK
ncbi:hypothetical protein OKW12_002233 [Pseudomonas silensiensis]|nr:hypothetical protein [Pseudomonas silensiensis]